VRGGKRRRPRRFGAVRELPSGRFQARYRDPETRQLRAAPQTFATRTDADVWLAVTEAELRKGTWVDPDAGRVPLGEYAEQWIAERPGLAPRTVRLYEGLLRNHIVPTLGSVDLVDLTPASIRAWRRGLLDGDVGAVTVAKCYRLLRSVLTTAVEDDELIRRNPCRIKGAGAEPSPERPIATPSQVQALAGAMPSRWRALVLLAVASSLRWGELMALTRADIDLRAGTVRVSRALVEDGGTVALGPTKSQAGRRTVALPAGVVPVLRAHMTEYAEKGATGRVFVGAKGAVRRRSNFAPMWAKAVKAAGLPAGFHFHDLRHTGNTWAAGSGANLRELMERMGHSSTRAALIYLHAASDGHRRIAEGIDRHLSAGDGADEG
jgi:integrase